MKKLALCLGTWMFCLAPMLVAGAQIGEPAPRLAAKEWVRGVPIDIQPGTNVFVLEVWTVGSPTCRAAITNLNALQHKYADKGLAIIGVCDQPLDRIKAFVNEDGKHIQYRIMADDDRQTVRRYMVPARQQVVPYSFVIGTNGLLLWHGMPTFELNRVLEQVFAGSFNLAQAATNQAARRQIEQYLNLTMHRDPRARAAGWAAYQARTNNVEQLCDLAFQIAVHPGLPRRDLGLANLALSRAEKISPTNSVRVNLTRGVVLLESGKTNEAITLAKQTLAAAATPQEKEWAQGTLTIMENRLKVLANPPSPATRRANRSARPSTTNAAPAGLTNSAPAERPGAAAPAPASASSPVKSE
jgi:peroxiredoxin